jgi:uncharacterized OsmC-like protein
MTSTSPATEVAFLVHAEGLGVAQTLTSDSHVFHADAHPAFGGADSAPSPLAYALGALSACNQVTASVVAAELGVRLGEWTFDVRGVFDPAVLATGVQGNANFRRVVVRARVRTDASERQFARLVAETERRCPVSQLFRHSGVELVNDWAPEPLATADER